MARSDAYDAVMTHLRGAPPPQPVIADMLARYADAVPPTVDAAIRRLRGGGAGVAERRRALALIWCMLLGARAADAADMAGRVAPATLSSALAAQANAVMAQTGGPLFRPAIQSLLAGPGPFLAANRIFTHSAPNSGDMAHDFTFIPHNAVYEIKPAGPFHDGPYAQTPAHNVAVQMYSAVRGAVTAIPCSVAGRDLVVTTQLSGCAILYRVSGPVLEVAHVRPDGGVAGDLPGAFAGLGGASSGRKLTEVLAWGGSLAGGGGTLGLYGCVDSPAEMGFRVVRRGLPGGGNDAIRVHGYCRTTPSGSAIRAYFIGVRQAGAWTLFGQRNDPMNAGAGVESLTRIFPL